QRRLVVAALVDGRSILAARRTAGGGPIAGVAVAVERARIDVERGVGLTVAAQDQLVGGRVWRRFVGTGGGGGRLDARQFAGFEQRVGFESFPNERLDLEVRQRQQLDRLLELRRHRQRLRLPQVE